MPNLEVLLGRIEGKIDDMRDHLHKVEISVSQAAVAQQRLETDLREAERQLEALRSAHDRAVGAVKLLLLPGVLAALAAGWKVLGSG